MLRLYRYLLCLYPADHRDQFGDEMIEVFRDAQADAAKQSMISRGVFCAREAAGLLTGAMRQHLLALGASRVWLPFPTRRFTMRNEFRFPKSTAVLMMIILAGVIVAIEKGEAIVASFLASPHFDFLPSIAWMFAAVYAVGAAGWVILFALRRSGVHRLETSIEQK
jgi:hypothetical protein